MRRPLPTRAEPDGFAMIITAVCLVMMVPVLGLTVDASIIYGIRAKLQTAGDSAAIAAARSLSIGQTLSAQTANAQTTAQNFFNANFPDGYFNTTGKTMGSTVSESSYKVRAVEVTASVMVPSLFMRYLSSSSTKVNAFSRAERRDTNVVMVLDRSGSMDGNGGCPAMKAATASFAMKFANNRDKVGMVTFGGDNRVDVPLLNPPGDFQNGPTGIPEMAANINCDGVTGTSSALWRGYEELKRINEPGALNVIVLMTDGQPNTLNLNFSAAVDTWGYNAIRWNLPAPAPQKYTADPSAGFDSATTRSSCSNTAGKIGVVNHFGSPLSGIFQLEAPAIPVPDGWSMNPLGAASTGCAFASDSGQLHRDVAFLPEQDAHGTPMADDTYNPVSRWPAGHPDEGRIRSDDGGSFAAASYNTVQNAAIRIRNNDTAASSLNVVIYAIGFGNGIGPAGEDMLQRAANVEASPKYDPTKPSGFYIWAPDPAALDSAFSTIASDVLRIAR